jgi:hypothetical protein
MVVSCTSLLGKLQEVNIISRVRGGKVAVGRRVAVDRTVGPVFLNLC